MDGNKLTVTEDGSHTLYSPEVGEHYHSTFGAIQESEHIFIRAGLNPFIGQQEIVNIFEMGFGTGLNALLTCLRAEKAGQKINYYGLEASPISMKTAKTLNYHELLNTDQNLFLRFHQPDNSIQISDRFFLEKKTNTMEQVILPDDHFDIVYFDAFSPEAQPELWTPEIFEKIFRAMKTGGILTTYSCKGIVKRAMKAAGFKLEKLPGPPGKREFLRATK
ncbi:MAG: SAM-dependent methyltransferase [Bacteroidetes bacterium]|nr:MAG: SAM-dependent methyltransferase [Bacteroidota bacterium]RLD71715.1 MAG: SAM-dependent methyltransferase [Bacteroidota bacterium]RLD87730.1 MAG: SAM-dependent methyltransferase [Bacteroidota bacterium]